MTQTHTTQKSFTVLEEVFSISSNNEIKKALKKLREIQVLKEKIDLSDCEIEKLAKEEYWENILNPKPFDFSTVPVKPKPLTQKQKEKLKLAKKRFARKVQLEEKEAKEKEAKEKEAREKEAKEKEAREKEARENGNSFRKKEFTDLELEKEWNEE